MVFAQVDVSETEVKDFRCAAGRVQLASDGFRRSCGRRTLVAGPDVKSKRSPKNRRPMRKQLTRQASRIAKLFTVFSWTFVLFEDFFEIWDSNFRKHSLCHWTWDIYCNFLSISYIIVATFQMKLDVDLLEYAFDGDLEANGNWRLHEGKPHPYKAKVAKFPSKSSLGRLCKSSWTSQQIRWLKMVEETRLCRKQRCKARGSVDSFLFRRFDMI